MKKFIYREARIRPYVYGAVVSCEMVSHHWKKDQLCNKWSLTMAYQFEEKKKRLYFSSYIPI